MYVERERERVEELTVFTLEKRHMKLSQKPGAAKKEVYPKVKVREHTDQDDDQHVVVDFCSTVKEYEEDISPPSIAKIPKSYIPSSIPFSFDEDIIPNIAMPKVSVLKGEEKYNNIDEDCKHNIRASSIPRPRAVLSSPDNDLVIGNKNRCKKERTPALKNPNLTQNRHALCKIIPTTTEDVINSKKSCEDSNESKGKKGKVMSGPTQRRQIRTGKPTSMRF